MYLRNQHKAQARVIISASILTVVCGLGNVVYHAAKYIREDSKRHDLIELNDDSLRETHNELLQPTPEGGHFYP